MPSLYEGSPNILLDSLNISLPVLSSNCSGAKDILAHQSKFIFKVDDIEDLINDKNILTFGKDNFLLFELSFFSEPQNLNEVIWSMREAGYNPVLAHVERYAYWHNDYDKVEEMVNRGVKLQMNIGSLTGSYGPEIKLFAEKLVDDEVVEFVGSDCHHIQHLEMLDYAKKLPYFHKLIQQEQILNNSL